MATIADQGILIVRRKIASIEKEQSIGCIERYAYTLSCGHVVAGDLRYWRGSKHKQPITAVCSKCQVTEKPAQGKSA